MTAAKPRRSLLFVPADRPDRVRKAFASDADAIAIDLEDGVSLDRKAEARAALRETMGDLDFNGKECFLRINGLTTVDCLHDLLLVAELEQKPHVIIAPKVESGRELALLDAWLSQLEPAGAEPIRIAAALESAEGFFRAAEIARSSRRLTAILFGGGDLSGQIGCP
ncbi:MAG TPA: aldolase/citrate lyase family protein, partial [Bacillota bacterium]